MVDHHTHPASSGSGHPPAIELREISKTFGTVRANKAISMAIGKGAIHGIVGENGAGKSTLMNILYGLHRADSGDILIDGQITPIHSSADAIRAGIGMVHQHFMLVPNFTVLENVMLGSEGSPMLKPGVGETRALLKTLGEEFDMHVDPDALIEDLPVGLQQRVEIIKAVKGGARILILDEPTGVLTPGEAESLFKILRRMKQDGVTVILITHKLSEIMAITDTVTVIRGGEVVGHRKTADTNPEELAELMVGRKVLLRVDRGAARPGAVLLEADGLECHAADGRPLLHDIDFQIRAGEILGIAGVAGNGQTELLEVLSGLRPVDKGRLVVMNRTVTRQSRTDPEQMRQAHVGHIPEDRHRHGLVLAFEARENAVLGFHKSSVTGEGALIDQQAMTAHCLDLMREFDVRPPNPNLSGRNFSGGNQQKLVIAREIDKRPRVLIVGQPTRGVDIGAIEFIHKQLIRLRDEGCAILLVSVELEEILGLSDRIMVMNAGRQVGIVPCEEADEQTLGLMMAGIRGSDAA
ncbi:MAG: ABC transporter ATP-binding protein [Alphaproteobacteria bacterium]|nr:ABC transporter ATP-binding protein [Alphaproteobacteria bacterium]